MTGATSGSDSAPESRSKDSTANRLLLVERSMRLT